MLQAELYFILKFVRIDSSQEKRFSGFKWLLKGIFLSGQIISKVCKARIKSNKD